ncbi:hypothetical protein KUTeg_010824 [Tegillarca granosa]|uniref:Fibrinogen C-terminal domain-containing protein n=1 Tax=Tegillarca granosa TaxID=220873 RepID=A0ABQ9F248_TEGGR|nr:hypothetical protein KUTeg_010824 [Tegillarca granosa]
MFSWFIIALLLSSVYCSLKVEQKVEKGEATVCFKFEPKYYDLKDYVEILKFTMNLLERSNKQSVRKNMLEMKHEIFKALAKPKRDCKSYYDIGIRKDGIYRLSPKGATPFHAYCDMKNGGWTVIQRRKFGDIPFNRKWVAYAEGFGNLDGDHWLGNRQIHQLTKEKPSQISFEFIMASNHANATAVYNGFYIDDEGAQFRMHVKPNAKYNKVIQKYIQDNGFYYHNNMKFSTVDRDNDRNGGNCASSSGYWYNTCYTLANINGDFNSMAIYNKATYGIIRSEIKIRRPF